MRPFSGLTLKVKDIDVEDCVAKRQVTTIFVDSRLEIVDAEGNLVLSVVGCEVFILFSRG
jgi:hypothetical protein